MPTVAGRTTPPGDPTLRMLGECACAVNWDAPGGGTAHATGRPLPRAPTGDAAANPGLGARAAAWFQHPCLGAAGQEVRTWKARRLLPWHSAGLDSWTGCPMRARTVLVSGFSLRLSTASCG